MDTIINKSNVINFFNTICDDYDRNNHQNTETLHKIMQYANVEQKDVLDIACGPGVLFDTYHTFNVNSLTAIDISENMIKKCKSKFPNYSITYHCMDAEEMTFSDSFDSIVLFNAFPHIANPEVLIQKVYNALRNNGTFTIAHGSSRECIDHCHSNLPDHLSKKLWDNKKIEELFFPYFEVHTSVDNEKMIVVSGKKR